MWVLVALGLGGCGQELVNCDVNGCSSDPCEQLCRDVTAEIRGCRESWGADWEILGATGQRDFRVACIEQWQTERSQMEAREIEIAEEACDDAREELTRLGCVELRALYL